MGDGWKNVMVYGEKWGRDGNFTEYDGVLGREGIRWNML